MVSRRAGHATALSYAVIVAFACTVSQAQSGAFAAGRSVDWATYGGQPAGDHFSSLTQINRK